MPYKERETVKLQYSIGEVAKMFGLNTSHIRFWEKEFPILKPYKNKKGDRFFTVKDIENIRIIYHLVKERGFTLEGARKKLKENKFETIDQVEIVKSLKNIKGFLEDLRTDLSKEDEPETIVIPKKAIEKPVEPKKETPKDKSSELPSSDELDKNELFLF
ncbi:MAG: MerR family transcriptional regulator [Bacteroidota bacterium]